MNWTSVSSSHLFFMKIIGLIPFEGKKLDSLASRFCSFLTHMVNLTYNCMWSGYGVSVFPEIFDVDYMCEVIIIQGVFFRYLVVYANRSRISKLVDICRRLWSQLCYNEGNETKQLIFRFWTEVHNEPAWSLVTLWQCIQTYYINVEIAGLEIVSLFLIMMASRYLRVLRERLNRLNDEKTDSSVLLYDEVLKCVKYHQDIMGFCEDIEVVTNKAFLIIVLTSSYNLSITGITLLDQNDSVLIVKYTTMLMLNLFQFFMAQYGPEHLLIESEAIGDAAYFATLRHSKFEKRTNKMLIFMMMRAQRPIQLTAGEFINLSIETFGRMLRSAFSFFALLRSLRE